MDSFVHVLINDSNLKAVVIVLSIAQSVRIWMLLKGKFTMIFMQLYLSPQKSSTSSWCFTVTNHFNWKCRNTKCYLLALHSNTSHLSTFGLSEVIYFWTYISTKSEPVSTKWSLYHIQIPIVKDLYLQGYHGINSLNQNSPEVNLTVYSTIPALKQ